VFTSVLRNGPRAGGAGTTVQTCSRWYNCDRSVALAVVREMQVERSSLGGRCPGMCATLSQGSDQEEQIRSEEERDFLMSWPRE
jgi:hypothetical protein